MIKTIKVICKCLNTLSINRYTNQNGKYSFLTVACYTCRNPEIKKVENGKK